MRDKSSRALKQSASIFLLVATLMVGLYERSTESSSRTGHKLAERIVGVPRMFLTDIAAVPAAPLHALSTRVVSAIDLGISAGPTRQDLENQLKRMEADLALRDLELQKARQQLESYQSFMAVPRQVSFFVWSGNLAGCVQGDDTDVFSRSYVLSVGSRDGVEKDLPVVWGNVAVGRIIWTGLLYSRVRILADPLSRVCVRFGSSRWEGVLVGSGRQICPVRLVSNRAAEEDIRVGDVVVTSGTDGMFPPDLVVGKVTRFARRQAEPEADVEVELWMDLSRLENCLVLKRLGAPQG